MKRTLCLIVSFILILPTLGVNAQTEVVQTSNSLSFEKQFSMVQGSVSIGNDQVSIEVTPNVELSFREDMIISSKASRKYSEEGKSATLTLDVTNVISSFELNGDLMISLSWHIGPFQDSKDIPAMDVNFKYSISEKMGSSQNIILGDYLLFAGTIPIAGLYVSIYMKPIVQYIPELSGSLTSQGSTSIYPSNVIWNSDSVTSQIDFYKTEPVNLDLTNTILTLSNFKMYLEFSAVIAFVPIPAVTFDVVSLGNEVLTSSTVNMLHFEPNLYALYTELENTLDSLTTTIAQLESSMTHVEDEIQSVNSHLISLSSELSLVSEKYDSLENSINQLEWGSTDIQISTRIEEILDDQRSLNSTLEDLTSQYNVLLYDVDSVEESLNQVRLSLASIESESATDGDPFGGNELTVIYMAFLFSIVGCAAGIYSAYQVRKT